MIRLATLAVLALVFMHAEGAAQREDIYRCTAPEHVAIERAIDAYCAQHPRDCEARSELSTCNDDFRGVTVRRRPGFVLVLHPDCWDWHVRLRPPPGADVTAFDREPAAALLAAGWRIVAIDLDVSHCD